MSIDYAMVYTDAPENLTVFVVFKLQKPPDFLAHPV
jgi:hypothetical protein